MVRMKSCPNHTEGGNQIVLIESNREVQEERLMLGGTHMTAPEELWVLHESVLCQFFMKQLVHLGLQAVPQLEKQQKMKRKFGIWLTFLFIPSYKPL